ncbi:TPA: ATP-binding protein [Candidatus Geothermarchaeota archaeon]|nr:ATP-binding protein [Candidatus Geothermarchaeota archaeon]
MRSYKDPEELRRLRERAAEYANMAVSADRRGVISLAITYYNKSIDILTDLINSEESPEFKRMYRRALRQYRDRVNYLRGVASGSIRSISNIRIRDGGEKVGKDIEKIKKEDILVPFKSSITWNDIVGLDNAKRVIKRSIVYPIRRPDLFPLGFPRAILLYGPPGCGKTSLAAALSNEIDAEFYPIDATMIMSKWLGESEKRVAEIFKYLRDRAQHKPVILYIDEVDSLLSIRNSEVGGEIRVRNQFLSEMDGLKVKELSDLPLFIVASTNRPWDLDIGFIRRFQKRIYIPPPDKKTRKEIFRFYLSKVNYNSDIDFDFLADYTKGYTPSDIRDVVQTAIIEVVSELFESGLANDPNAKPRPVSMEDLRQALKRVRPSVSHVVLTAYENWMNRFRSD